MASTTILDASAFMRNLSAEQRSALYHSPWTCQAVFRSLPSMAKNYVLRLLLVDEAVPEDVVSAWVLDMRQFGVPHREALKSLLSLDVYVKGSEAGRATYRLHPTFQAHMQRSLSTGGQMLQDLPLEVLQAAPSPAELDSFAHEHWEALQMYILDSSYDGPQLPPEVPVQPLDFHAVLLSAGLLLGDRDARSITDAGFQFLMCESHRQLWTFLRQYITDAAAASRECAPGAAEGGRGGGGGGGGGSGDSLQPLMSFIMQLGFMRVGRPYALASLSPMEAVVAGHMMQLGLLLPFEVGGCSFFAPTRLASSLCGGGGGSSADADIAGGHVIVESNFKVHAWTTSRVQRSLLGLFCRVEAVLPNFWVGALTHDSVGGALGAGIGAEEIVEYLKAHAHPHVAMRKPIVPENVSDQVMLWQAESRRMQADAAMLYESFETPELFHAALGFAVAHELLLWASQEQRAFASKEGGHDRVRNYIKAVKLAQAQGAPIPSPRAA